MKNITIIAILLLTITSCTKQTPTIVSKQSMNSVLTQPQLLVGTWLFAQTYNNNVLTYPMPNQTYSSTSYVRYNANGTYVDSISTGTINGSGTYTIANSVITASNGVLTIIQLDEHNLVYTSNNGQYKSCLTK